MERVSFPTADEVIIVGSFLESPAKKTCAFLVHMMPATKESWQSFMQKLAEHGISSLAIDLRGHGESIKQNAKILDYKKFSDEEHRGSIRDIEAAMAWLKTRGIGEDKITIIGASIGANLALRYVADHPNIKKIALLSPGLDYRGTATETAATKMRPDQTVLLAASDDDGYSFRTIETLHFLLKDSSILLPLHNAGHGTDMLDNQSEFLEALVDWTVDNFMV